MTPTALTSPTYTSQFPPGYAFTLPTRQGAAPAAKDYFGPSSHQQPQVMFGGPGTTAMKSFGQFIKDPNGRKIAFGAFLQWGLPTLLGASLLTGLPGIALILIGLIPVTLLSKLGERIVAKGLVKMSDEGRKEDIYSRALKMLNIWDAADTTRTSQEQAKEFTEHVNGILDDLVPENTAQANTIWQRVRNFFHLPDGTPKTHRVMATIMAKFEFSRHRLGRWMNKVLGWFRKIPGIRNIALMLSIGLNGLVLFFKRKQITAIIETLVKGAPAAARAAV